MSGTNGHAPVTKAFSVFDCDAHVNDPNEIWSRYVEHATQQYSEELQTLSDLYSQQVWEAIDDLQQGIAAGVETTRVSARS